jgi:hypothetical protein
VIERQRNIRIGSAQHAIFRLDPLIGGIYVSLPVHRIDNPNEGDAEIKIIFQLVLKLDNPIFPRQDFDCQKRRCLKNVLFRFAQLRAEVRYPNAGWLYLHPLRREHAYTLRSF